MNVYLDTSAATKLLVNEPESDAVAGYLDGLATDEDLVSSALMETELRRVAVREDLTQESVSAILARVGLVEPTRSLFHEAGLLPGATLRSLDALHLATALRLEAVVVAYDSRTLASARSLGLDVMSPQ